MALTFESLHGQNPSLQCYHGAIFLSILHNKIGHIWEKKAPKDGLFNSPSSEFPLMKVLSFLTLSLTLAGDGFETRGVIGQL